MSSTFTNLLYHIIFSTKERLPLITTAIRDPLYQYIGGIIRNERGILLEIGGIEDHVHILARFKPSVAVSDMVRDIKANSSKWLNESPRDVEFRWQNGYGAFSVSESKVKAVRRYIQRQPEHHAQQTFRDEFIGFLDAHGVAYDPKDLDD